MRDRVKESFIKDGDNVISRLESR